MMNQKNHFVSTYQKDYPWPFVSDTCQAEPPTKRIAVCACTDSPRVVKEFLDVGLEKYLDRTKQLLEPKICRPILQAQPIQLDRPSKICVKKRNGKSSNMREILQEISPHLDRFKTTYQAHYSDPAARVTQRELARAITIHTNGQQLRCHMPIKITIETDCPPPCPSSSRVNADVKRDYKLKTGYKREKKCEVAGPETRLPPWRSEYQDSINKIGHAIMRVKLHHAKKKTFPLQYQQCISN